MVATASRIKIKTFSRAKIVNPQTKQNTSKSKKRVANILSMLNEKNTILEKQNSEKPIEDRIKQITEHEIQLSLKNAEDDMNKFFQKILNLQPNKLGNLETIYEREEDLLREEIIYHKKILEFVEKTLNTPYSKKRKYNKEFIPK